MTYEKKDIDYLRIVLNDIHGTMFTDATLIRMLELCEVFHHLSVLAVSKRESFGVSNEKWAEEVMERLKKLEKLKKTVVKEAKEYIGTKGVFSATEYYNSFIYPQNAKNIKCTYEVEE